jgi:hypothetical protein
MFKKYLVMATALVTLCSGIAFAQLRADPTNNLVAAVVDTPKWSLTLGGLGITPVNDIGGNWTWGGELGLSRAADLGFVNTDLGARQMVAYGKVGSTPWTKTENVAPPCCGEDWVTSSGTTDKNGWVLRTEVFWDWTIPIYGRLSAFVGPNVGFVYGNVSPQWTVGPEAGFKLELSSKVFTFARLNYDWNLSNPGADALRATAGLGIKL